MAKRSKTESSLINALERIASDIAECRSKGSRYDAASVLAYMAGWTSKDNPALSAALSATLERVRECNAGPPAHPAKSEPRQASVAAFFGLAPFPD